MRIVGGRFKGRQLTGPKSSGVRPTSDRLRETIFNILAHAYDDPANEARVLDLFAGTGALGLEALSRGAAFAQFVDDSSEGRALLRENIETMGVAGITKVFRRDATKLGAIGATSHSRSFSATRLMARGFAPLALASALVGGWLAPAALVMVEEAADAEFACLRASG